MKRGGTGSFVLGSTSEEIEVEYERPCTEIVNVIHVERPSSICFLHLQIRTRL